MSWVLWPSRLSLKAVAGLHMFSSAFVARIATATSGNRVELFCRVDESAAAAAALPPEQNLGGFCFPVGPENVFPKEYSRPEVNIHSPCLQISGSVLRGPSQPQACQASLMGMEVIEFMVIAGIFLHFDWWRWCKNTWLLQASWTAAVHILQGVQL